MADARPANERRTCRTNPRIIAEGNPPGPVGWWRAPKAEPHRAASTRQPGRQPVHALPQPRNILARKTPPQPPLRFGSKRIPRRQPDARLGDQPLGERQRVVEPIQLEERIHAAL